MRPRLTILILAAVLLAPYSLNAFELSGYIETEGRLFAHDPMFDGQAGDNVSLALSPEFYHEFTSSSLTFVPFARLDSEDDERSHIDIRELNMLFYGDDWELGIGIGKIFWGVTESQHLVDIINQTDLVESIDGEEKLGQPMVSLSLIFDAGTVDLFILPYFRERTFPGKRGRLRLSAAIDTDNPIYESDDKENHVDAAIRYSHTIGDWDIGLSHFSGTGREPTFRVSNATLVPYYELIEQTGLDLQMVKNEWLLKLESIYRSGQGNDDFYALATGFEYTFSGAWTGGMEIGTILEWLYDDRSDKATTAFDNDIMYGMRISLNDISDTQILFGVIEDYNNGSTAFALESTRRLTDNVKLSVEASIFNPSAKDSAYDLSHDDHIDVEVSYYF